MSPLVAPYWQQDPGSLQSGLAATAHSGCSMQLCRAKGTPQLLRDCSILDVVPIEPLAAMGAAGVDGDSSGVMDAATSAARLRVTL